MPSAVACRNNLECAIAEAAFMTGLERNADVVCTASYAPLFAHVDGWQWTPNLIWVDNLCSYGTPNDYVQKLFANHRGDIVLPVKLDGAEGKRLYASATRDDKSGEVIAKLVNGDNAPADVSLNVAGEARLIMLTGANRAEEDSLAEPTKIAPKENKLTLATGKPLTLPANSMSVLRVSLGK